MCDIPRENLMFDGVVGGGGGWGGNAIFLLYFLYGLIVRSAKI